MRHTRTTTLLTRTASFSLYPCFKLKGASGVRRTMLSTGNGSDKAVPAKDAVGSVPLSSAGTQPPSFTNTPPPPLCVSKPKNFR